MRSGGRAEKRATCYVLGATCSTCCVLRAACPCRVRRATCDVRRATCDVRRATCRVRRAACDVPRATCDARGTACTRTQPVRRGTGPACSTSYVEHVAPAVGTGTRHGHEHVARARSTSHVEHVARSTLHVARNERF